MMKLISIPSDVINRLEHTEQAQWKKINELEHQNVILRDENMHLKDYLAELKEENKRLKMELNAYPCLTNRPRKEAKNE